MIPWLEAADPFPPVERALEHPNGLLCAGADLSLERLLEAYRRGMAARNDLTPKSQTLALCGFASCRKCGLVG